jgi:hypothetical protein
MLTENQKQLAIELRQATYERAMYLDREVEKALVYGDTGLAAHRRQMARIARAELTGLQQMQRAMTRCE